MDGTGDPRCPKIPVSTTLHPPAIGNLKVAALYTGMGRVSPEKQSMREAMVHLLARYREMRPLFLAAARPMKVEWKMRPYFGVLPRVFSAL